jgi:chemotaxis signal transduction protein
MFNDKAQYETNRDLGSYMEELLNPYEVEVKIEFETQYEVNLDLGLYIEGLLNTDETEVNTELKNEVNVEIKKTNDVVASGIEVNIFETGENIGEQPQIPLWGEKPFECLLIKSAGISLMVPAMPVSYIERINNKKIIRLPSYIKAFRGMVTLRERSVAIIDLFSLISENTSINSQQAIQIDTDHIEYVLVMENSDYALACDDVCKIIMLNTENVRWNKGCFNNPIFAGIVPEYLCPIVNIEHIQEEVSKIPFM